MLERKHTPRYPAELRVRGVRLIKENRSNYSSDSAAYASIAEKLGCSRFPLREWCIQAERDAGERPGRSSSGKNQHLVAKDSKQSAMLLFCRSKSI